jgi:hypothetical protein
MATEHQVDDTTIEQEQADFVRRTAGATETKLSQAGQDAPATPPPSATDGTSLAATALSYARVSADSWKAGFQYGLEQGRREAFAEMREVFAGKNP